MLSAIASEASRQFSSKNTNRLTCKISQSPFPINVELASNYMSLKLVSSSKWTSLFTSTITQMRSTALMLEFMKFHKNFTYYFKGGPTESIQIVVNQQFIKKWKFFTYLRIYEIFDRSFAERSTINCKSRKIR